MRPLLFAAALSLAACQSAADPAAQPAPAAGRDIQLYKINAVTLAVLKSQPPGLSIKVEAIAPTPGYKNLRLVPVNYIQKPPDGIYDFTAVGAPPPGAAAGALTPVTFTYTWSPLGSDVKGVRVHASSGSVLAMLAP